MSVLVGAETRLVVQGITGSEGTFHTLRNRNYGTNVVSGVTPGKGGRDVDGIPVFETVAEARRETGANTSMIFVPPRFAAEAILEAADAGIALVVCITEGIPVRDMAEVHAYLPGTEMGMRSGPSSVCSSTSVDSTALTTPFARRSPAL